MVSSLEALGRRLGGPGRAAENKRAVPSKARDSRPAIVKLRRIHFLMDGHDVEARSTLYLVSHVQRINVLGSSPKCILRSACALGSGWVIASSLDSGTSSLLLVASFFFLQKAI